VTTSRSARYQSRSLVRTYLYAIAINLVSGERRRRQNRSAPLESIAEPAASDAQENAIWLKQALSKLRDLEREILMLREYELSYSEIADLMRIPVNTARSRLFRARMALRATWIRPSK
jgi:RNA polymerase sigma-70 factor, ECF subfamily